MTFWLAQLRDRAIVVMLPWDFADKFGDMT